MAKTVCLLALASLIPSTFSAPILGREECICQPIDFTGSDNSSLASCEAIAQDIRQWRALAFHSPYLADVFVDAEEQLRQVPRTGQLEKRRFAHELHTIHHPKESLRTTFDQAVRDIFRRIKKPSRQDVITSRKGSSSLEPPTLTTIRGSERPSWPWEQEGLQDQSPGSAMEKTSSKPTFLQASHRYRILCRSKDLPRASYLAARPDVMLIASIVIVALWLFVCDMTLAMCRSYLTSPDDNAVERAVVLEGDEKRIYAYTIEVDDFEASVTPAISDL